jgi:8-oxo-dGTP diphosphatase
MDGHRKREYPDFPILGVGGVIFRNQSVLLVRRAQAPAMGHWSLPGGAVELGETVLEALDREIYEEASIKIETKGFVRLLDKIFFDNKGRIRFHYVIADYWGWFVSGRLNANSDISEAKFVHLTEIPSMGIDKDVKETIEMAVRMRDVI